MRLFALIFVVVVGGAALSGAVSASSSLWHTTLEASSPAAGDTLSAAPLEAALSFGGPVEVTGSVLTLLGPGGRRWTLEPMRSATDARLLTGALPALDSGGYRLEWRVVSADGHAITGDFVFYVAGGDAEAMSDPPASGRPDGAGAHDDSAGEAVDIPVRLFIARSGADLALLTLAGLLVFVSSGSGGAPRTRSVADILALAGAVSVTAYAWMWAGGVLGVAAGFEERVGGLLSLGSGRALAAETGLAWLTAWALLLARRPGIGAAFALIGVAIGGAAGHPASYSPVIATPAASVHLLAAAVWVGGLVFLVGEHGSATFGESARRVSSAALVAVVVIAVTGVAQSWLYLRSLPSPVGSAYEQLLLVKVVGYAGLLAFGAYHRKRLVPTADAEDGALRLSQSVRRELVLAACVVVVAAMLSHISPTP